MPSPFCELDGITAFIQTDMDRKTKSKKSIPQVHDPDAPDSLVSALAGEILAPENISLIIPLTVFTVHTYFDNS